jgi:hypothetical protein
MLILRKSRFRSGGTDVEFGSIDADNPDWPHGAGPAQSTDFEKVPSGFSPDDVRKIMPDNCLDLLGSGR